MATEKRLIDAMSLVTRITSRVRGMSRPQDIYDGVLECIADAPTIDAVELPCKICDPVWFVRTSNTNRLKAGIIETTVEKLVLKSGGIYMKLSCNAMYETSCRSIGKSVFFTRKEAEAALAKLDGGSHEAG